MTTDMYPYPYDDVESGMYPFTDIVRDHAIDGGEVEAVSIFSTFKDGIKPRQATEIGLMFFSNLFAIPFWGSLFFGDNQSLVYSMVRYL